MDDGYRVKHQLLGQHTGQTVHGANFGNRQAQAGLLSVLQSAEYSNGTVARLNGIAASADIVAVAAMAYQRGQSCHACRMAEGLYLVQHRVLRVVCIHIDILHSFGLGNGGESVVQRQYENQQDATGCYI